MAYTRRRRYGTRRRIYRRTNRRTGYYRRSRISVFKKRAELSGTDLARQTFHIRLVKTVQISANQQDSTIAIVGDDPSSGSREGAFSILEALNNDQQWLQYSNMYD